VSILSFQPAIVFKAMATPIMKIRQIDAYNQL